MSPNTRFSETDNFRSFSEYGSPDLVNIDQDIFITNSKNKYGYKGAREATELLSRASALFAGGELDDEAKELFGKDLYAAATTGIEILEAEPGYAKCALKIEDRHKNALGQVMGGVFFVMADFAFAIASNFKQKPTVTQTSQIVYLSPVKGSTLYAETEKIRAGRSTCFYKISITDDTGALCAYITTSGFIIN